MDKKLNKNLIEINFNNQTSDEEFDDIDEYENEENLYDEISDDEEASDRKLNDNQYDPTLSEFYIEKPIAKINERVNKGIISLPFQCAKIIQKFDKNNRKLTNSNNAFDLKNLWKEVVDDDIASMTFPLKITNKGVLYISILNSSVASLISHLSDEIIEKVNCFFGSDIVKKIKIESVQN